MFGTLFNQKNTEAGDNNQLTDQVQTAPPVNDQNVVGLSPSDPKLPDPSPSSDANPVSPLPDDAGQSRDEAVAAPIDLSTQDNQNQPDNNSANNSASSAIQKDPSSLDASALSHLDPRAAQALTHAQEEAKRIKQQFIEPQQILFGLLYDEQIYKTLGEFKADGGVLSKEIQANETMGVFRGQPTLSTLSQSAFEQAYKDAKMHGSNFVSPEDLLLVLFDPQFGVSLSLEAKGLKKETLVEKVAKNPNLNYGKKTILEKYGIDLNEQARSGKLDPIAGRDAEIDRMVHILLRRTKNNPIIIGETGVGKTAIVEGLAQKIVNGGVPKDLSDKRIFQLDVTSLIAGASHRGEFEERLRGVINEVLGSNNKIVLFIDEIHSLLGTGEGEGVSAANIIKPHLARGHLQIIGATTTVEYRRNFEKDKAFERRFQPVTAEEPSEENAFEMLKVLRSKYEKFHRVTLPDDSLMECVKLSKKYIGERYLPDKAVDLLDEAGAEVKLQMDSGTRSDAAVKKEDIEKVVSAWTGIPITKLTEDESEKLLKLEDRIHKRLIDQEEAVVAVSEAVRRGRIGLAAANRPIASFVFLGPTGVGKTELAKTLAELLFGRDDAMTRLDMSEYMEKHEVAKLIGAPPGYVGYEEGGQLTEAVRKKPYSIVLLDEIEKAHPDVFNLLLQLLEDGRLTDNKGNTVSFKNTIVICTSNIGSSVIQERLSHEDVNVKKSVEDTAKTFEELTEIVKNELIKFFRPELLNRFDEVVIFKPLLMEHMSGIARLGIGKTAGLLKEQGFTLTVTERAIEKLAHDGFDPVYGARPLRRLIQTAIENPIALEIISKKFGPGDAIVVDFSEGTNEFTFSKEQSAADVKENSQSGEVSFSGEELAKIKKIFQQIVNPLYEAAPANKERFSKLYDKVQSAAQEGNALAKSIMVISETTPDADLSQLMDQLQKGKERSDPFPIEVLNTIIAGIQAEEAENLREKLTMLVNPAIVQDASVKPKFADLHVKISQEAQKGNALAASVLSVSESIPDEALIQLGNQIRDAASKNDETAKSILDVLDGVSDLGKSQEDPAQTLPQGQADNSGMVGLNPAPTSPIQPSPAQAGSAMQAGVQDSVQSSIGQAPVGPTGQESADQSFGVSSGMSALNEYLQSDQSQVVNNPVEEDGEEVR